MGIISMLHSEFVHLHLHTQYSLLDGACRIPEIIQLAHKYKMDSLCITDHGNMFGAIEFYIDVQRAGIKPIIGCEVYIAPSSRFDKLGNGIDEASYHFVLLVRDEEGYKNLMRLVSIGYLEGFYYRPRIDKEILSKYSKGLIGLSSCLKGEIPVLLQQNRFNDALKVADDFRCILGKENFFLELQENLIPEQKIVNKRLIEISKQLGIPLVATNDVHYITQDKAFAHEILLCIQTQTNLSDPERLRFQTNEFYFKSPQQMKELFKDIPEAISNTLEIASRCNLELDFSKIHLPPYEVPDGKTKIELLRELCLEGLSRRYKDPSEEIKNRLEYELKVIEKMGFSSYFLIVWDFIHYAKEQGIPVGPGRGSAAGSLVSYLLGITDIDPLKYGLLFERFLNHERRGLPDIDIDFCYERRQEVIDYVRKKYGENNVAQIITFGTMQARAVIRDVGRVMGMSYSEVDRIAKLIPADPDITLKEALEIEPELKNLYSNDPRITKLIDIAMDLEGLNRHASIHAAGVVIADNQLTEYMPLFKTSDGKISTGYSMQALEKTGLLKVDFLGLRTLTVIDQTLKSIEKRRGLSIKIDQVPLDDALTFKLLSAGQTIGIFQLESSGMRELLKRLIPDRIEDLIALLALYRPGPMGSGMLQDFIERRHNPGSIKYEHKKLEPILKETYGILVYQEQVMQIVSELGGFTLSQADVLRRAMSKKIPEVMEEQRKNFILGCKKNNISENIANRIFDLIEHFARYGFNKSHSAAYAMISYRTAYLKANYPIEFMNALLNSEKDNPDKIVEYINEANRMGIRILPPDINESLAEFQIVDDRTIRFGLLAIKNVGSSAVESIIKIRNIKNRFNSFEDFCQNVDSRVVNRKVIESLIKAGAFDSFGLFRAQMMVMLDDALSNNGRAQRERIKGQISFFEIANNAGFQRIELKKIPSTKEWPQSQLLAFEKEMLGVYISGHPLNRFVKEIKLFSKFNINELSSYKEADLVSMIGLIIKVKQTLTRNKEEKMAILRLEDLGGAIEVLVFPDIFKQVYKDIQPNNVVLVKGRLTLKEDNPKIIAQDIIVIDKLYSLINAIKLDISGIKEDLFFNLKQRLQMSPGKVPIYLYFGSSSKRKLQLIVGEDLFVEPSHDLIQDIESILGENRISLFF
ncbi:MAG: DNA polymerase III subunit alpha [Candidatus Omnitrophica bacterium]|nr:DNA polymerase III subunit alpha [Candidatus Omnitrophota bacterium]